MRTNYNKIEHCLGNGFVLLSASTGRKKNFKKRKRRVSENKKGCAILVIRASVIFFLVVCYYLQFHLWSTLRIILGRESFAIPRSFAALSSWRAYFKVLLKAKHGEKKNNKYFMFCRQPFDFP